MNGYTKNLILLVFVVGFGIPQPLNAETSTSAIDLMSLSIEELMEIEIRPTATLTQTSTRNRPAAVTVISRQEIENSGARSLDELLDIYVPNFQMFLHSWGYQHIGIRGNIFDRDDKYLLLVNGQIMNERMHYGALSERDLPMLSDLQRIEVVRGAGSALYGPGALVMLINLITETAETFEGTEVINRVGAIDEFYSSEFKYGRKFDDEGRLFSYVGIAKQPGMHQSDAPYVSSAPYSLSGTDYSGTRPRSFSQLAKHNASFRDRTKAKVHLHYTKDDLNLWARYTRGGQHYSAFLKSLGWSGYLDQGMAYDQLSLFLGNKYHLSDTLNIDYSFSYSLFDFVRHRARDIDSHRQDKYHTRVISNWTPNPDHSFAFGGEWLHKEFGLASLGYPDKEPQSQVFGYNDRMPRWSTDNYAIMGEHQWTLADQWTLFTSGRIDWHTFTRPMVSPKMALIYRPTDPDTLKLILQRAVRASTAEEMKKAHDSTGKKSDYESMESLELRWEREHSRNLWFAASAFYSDHSVVAWSGSSDSTEPLGDLKLWGLELELTHKTDKSAVTFSHGYTSLIDFKLENPGTQSMISAKPYGGDGLASWNDHVTKITGNYQVDEKLSVNGSLNTYWGMSGGKDFAAYRHSVESNSFVSGFDDPFEPSVFLNLGLRYQFSKNVDFSVHAHNVLGWFDRDLNKVNKIASTSRHEVYGYRLISPSISFTLRTRF